MADQERAIQVLPRKQFCAEQASYKKLLEGPDLEQWAAADPVFNDIKPETVPDGSRGPKGEQYQLSLMSHANTLYEIYDMFMSQRDAMWGYATMPWPQDRNNKVSRYQVGLQVTHVK